MKWGIHFNLAHKEERVKELEQIMEDPDFWSDTDRAQGYMKELKNLKDELDEYKHLKQSFEVVQTLIQIGYEENDESLLPEIEEALNLFINELESMKIKTLLSGEFDQNNAILTLHAGAGGTESCDWASMLCRMYQRWAEKRGFSTEILDFLDGEEAGLKSVTIQINGDNAYGYLKSEHGVLPSPYFPIHAAGKDKHPSFPAM